MAHAPAMPGAEPHPFDAAVALVHEGGDRFAGHTHPAWANMVGPFGGITAAQALQAVLRHPACLGEPVALTVNYAAALADGPFTVTARAARTNRSTQHWVIEFTQDGQTVVTGTAMTALRRDTFGVVEHAMPQVPAPADVPLPTGRGRVEWINRYELRFVEGGFPTQWDDSDRGHSRTRVWMRDRQARALDHASLAAMADVFFPRVWSRRTRPVPLGTVSMSVYFLCDSSLLASVGAGHVLGQAQGQGFYRGYFDQTAQLWSQAGQLLATTHQVVYYKE